MQGSYPQRIIVGQVDADHHIDTQFQTESSLELDIEFESFMIPCDHEDDERSVYVIGIANWQEGGAAHNAIYKIIATSELPTILIIDGAVKKFIPRFTNMYSFAPVIWFDEETDITELLGNDELAVQEALAQQRQFVQTQMKIKSPKQRKKKKKKPKQQKASQDGADEETLQLAVRIAKMLQDGV